jgi:hypothetical protein
MGRSLLSALGMAIFMLAVPRYLYQNGPTLLIIISSAIIIYFLLLYVFKGITKDDLKIIIPDKKNI